MPGVLGPRSTDYLSVPLLARDHVAGVEVDMIQSHLLQVVAVVAPLSVHATGLRAVRAEVTSPAGWSQSKIGRTSATVLPSPSTMSA